MSLAQRRREWMAQLGTRLANRASRKRKTWVDNLATRLLRDAIDDPEGGSDDFMKDELVDADIEFDPAELEAFEKSGSRSPDR